MKSFGAYISKYLASFAAFILLLLFINVIIFVVAFRKTVTEDYGAASPRTMLERTAASVLMMPYQRRQHKDCVSKIFGRCI